MYACIIYIALEDKENAMTNYLDDDHDEHNPPSHLSTINFEAYFASSRIFSKSS